MDMKQDSTIFSHSMLICIVLLLLMPFCHFHLVSLQFLSTSSSLIPRGSKQWTCFAWSHTMINVGKWHGRISAENSGSFNNFKNVSKSAFFRGFWTFSRNLALELVLFVDENGSTNQIWGFCENRTSGKIPVLEIFIPKGQVRFEIFEN